ncbi:DegV family protein [Blautia faecis]|mgnify:FL=1|uniref:DegV family protein n=1 Tax=Blautia faecis TaxID=871665 RepID=UPI0016553BCA|nr:DegV family protein [Blautia faecis]MBC8615377.1 DegV family protein [Blautia faecis]
MSYKIVIDSCGELLEQWKQDERFASVPLTLTVGSENIIDDETFNQADFLQKVAACPECPKSACPSPESYRKVFDCEAEHIYCVTLSAELSGSYNSAVLGASLLHEEKKGVQIHVFNSCSASIGQTLIAMKIAQCEDAGLPFEDVVSVVNKYIEEQHTFFVLENLETLRKNGRLSRVKALVATALKIKPIMGSTPEGTICQLDQARGMNKALVKMVDKIVEVTENSENKILAISHCNSPKKANMLKEAIQEKMKLADIVVLDTAGVSSMYANDGGIIVAV